MAHACKRNSHYRWAVSRFPTTLYPCASGSVCHRVAFDCSSEWFSFSLWSVLALSFSAQGGRGETEILSLALLLVHLNPWKRWNPGYTHEVKEEAGALLWAPAPSESYSFSQCPPGVEEVAMGPAGAMTSPPAPCGSHSCISASSGGAAFSGC